MSFLDDLFGSALLGIIFNAWMVGAMCIQAYHYYVDFPRDKVALKILVAFTVVLQLFNLSVQSAMIYRYLVLSWGMVNNILQISWSWVIYLGLIAIAACTVQIFYAYRIFILNGRQFFVPAVIVLLSLVATGSCWAVVIKGLTTSKQFDQLEQAKWIFLLWLPSAGAADVSIAIFQVYYLHRNRSGLPSVNRFVNILILYLLSTGLLTSLLVLVEVLTFAILGFNFAHVFLSYQMGAFHTVSFLANLDARRHFKEVDAADNGLRSVVGPNGTLLRALETAELGQWEVGLNSQSSQLVNRNENLHSDFTEKSLVGGGSEVKLKESTESTSSIPSQTIAVEHSQ